MNNFVGWLLGALLALLAGWGSLQKRKVDKALSKAKEAEQRAQKAEMSLKISKTASKAKDEIVMAQKENQKKKEAVDMQIAENEIKEDPDEKRKNQEKIANGITDLFNARNAAR